MSTTSTSIISNTNLSALAAKIPSAQLEINAPLKNHTWMKVGGPADLLFTAHTQDDLVLAATLAGQYQIPLFVLGGGSNLIIKDGGIRGLVVKNRAANIFLSGLKGAKQSGRVTKHQAWLTAESGAFVNQLVRYSLDESLAGLQNFLGIPGTVGGAVYNNAHHLDSLIGDTIKTVTVVDAQGKIKTYQQAELRFGYDYSLLQQTHELILSATFSLTAGDRVSLWAEAESALKHRRETQPLELPSSGCMFKNLNLADALIHQTPDGTISTGRLIDLAGLKGKTIGGAQVSTKHANFIVNLGDATAADIEKLAQLVASTVKNRFGVTLAYEVFFVGE